MTLHSWVPRGRFKQLVIRKGRGRGEKRGAVRKRWSSLEQGLVPPQVRHITIFLAVLQMPRPLTKWKILTIWWSILCSRETVTQSLVKPWNLENHRSPSRNHLMPNILWIEGMQSLHVPWPLSAISSLILRLLTNPLDWDTQFWGYHPAVPPLA